MTKTAVQALDHAHAKTTIATITDEQIYAAKHHARGNDDFISSQLMSIALERATSHPAVQIALAYAVDYFNAKIAS
jgi:hypothetical protein